METPSELTDTGNDRTEAKSPSCAAKAPRSTGATPACIASSNGEQAVPRGRQPEGARAFGGAERQARYRARHQPEQAAPAVRWRRPSDRRTRSQRWHDAVAELIALQTEYVAWLDALPDALQGTSTADALQAIAGLDLDDLAAIEPPRGYGRD